MMALTSRILEQAEFLTDVVELIRWCNEKGYAVTGGELERTAYQQAEYVRTGRSKTLQSNHIKRQAVDLHFFAPDGTYLTEYDEIKFIGDYWVSLHAKNRWGGNFSTLCDCPHFERNS
jgi:hypothetical protein